MADARQGRAAVLLPALLVAIFAAVPAIAYAIGQPFYITLTCRIMVLALAALGLNLALGFGGMVSFGHSLYVGIGAYAVGILSFHGVSGVVPQLAAGLAAGLVLSLLIGLVCLRTTGMSFIMITLAFSQMFYYLVISLRQYGGDDGMPLVQRTDFSLFDLSNRIMLYYITLALLLAALYLSWRLVHARFGLVLRACKANERRTLTLGYRTIHYRLLAYVLSALICVVAGMLLANLTSFTSPTYMNWILSGELIVMIVLGGMGTIAGPLIGAAVLVVFEELLSSLRLGLPGNVDALVNSHWMAFLGLFIIFVTLKLRNGLYGSLTSHRIAR